jgi:hypothetical protein
MPTAATGGLRAIAAPDTAVVVARIAIDFMRIVFAVTEVRPQDGQYGCQLAPTGVVLWLCGEGLPLEAPVHPSSRTAKRRRSQVGSGTAEAAHRQLAACLAAVRTGR